MSEKSGETMSETTGHTLGDIMKSILTAIQETLYYIADAIASNAQVIATVIVIGGLAYALLRYGTRMFRGISGWLRFGF